MIALLAKIGHGHVSPAHGVFSWPDAVVVLGGVIAIVVMVLWAGRRP